jgi:hypothetical protein
MTTKLEDRTTWPPLFSIWRHHNGNHYEVVMFTNVESDRQDKYPTTIVYRNVRNLNDYSRPLIDWDRSMTLWGYRKTS